MSLPELRGIASRLHTSAGALGVLGAAIDARVSGQPFDPAIRTRVDAVLDALGAKEIM